MPNYAQVTLIGHLGKDPEERQVGDHTLCSFSLATSKKRKGKDEITTWWNVTAWNKTAQLVLQYLKKGSPCLVVGDAFIRQYEKKDGTPGSSLEVDADRVLFLGGRKEESEDLGEAKTVGEGVAKLKAMAAKADDSSVPF